MSSIVESPALIVVVGILGAAGFGIALVRTGRGIYLVAIAVVAAITGAGVLLERLIVTEREEVEAVIDSAASAVRRNDMQGVLDHLAPEARPARSLIQWAFGRAVFDDVRITRLEIKVIKTASPPLAKAVITGFVRCRDRLGEYPYDAVPIDGVLELRKIDGRWRISGYEIRQDPRGHAGRREDRAKLAFARGSGTSTRKRSDLKAIAWLKRS